MQNNQENQSIDRLIPIGIRFINQNGFNNSKFRTHARIETPAGNPLTGFIEVFCNGSLQIIGSIPDTTTEFCIVTIAVDVQKNDLPDAKECITFEQLRINNTIRISVREEFSLNEVKISDISFVANNSTMLERHIIIDSLFPIT